MQRVHNNKYSLIKKQEMQQTNGSSECTQSGSQGFDESCSILPWSTQEHQHILNPCVSLVSEGLGSHPRALASVQVHDGATDPLPLAHSGPIKGHRNSQRADECHPSCLLVSQLPPGTLSRQMVPSDLLQCSADIPRSLGGFLDHLLDPGVVQQTVPACVVALRQHEFQ